MMLPVVPTSIIEMNETVLHDLLCPHSETLPTPVEDDSLPLVEILHPRVWSI